MKVIFLDIDGVLNLHSWSQAAQRGHRYFLDECVTELNRIIAETGAKIVLSSAWRYLIHQGDMSLLGFEYLLKTHGAVSASVIGVTLPAEKTPGYDSDARTRGRQIEMWLSRTEQNIETFVILDDDGDFNERLKPHFVRCNPSTGLTAADAERAIEILGAGLRSPNTRRTV